MCGSSIPEDQRQRFAQGISEQARRLARMLDDLESLSPAAEDYEAMDEFDPAATLRRAADEIRLALALRGMSVRVQAPAEGGKAHGSTELLFSLMAWIGEIAVRAPVAGDEVVLVLEQHALGSRAVVRMGNRGIGEGECRRLVDFDAASSPPDLVRGIAAPLRISIDNFVQGGGRVEVSLEGGEMLWKLTLPDVTARRAA